MINSFSIPVYSVLNFNHHSTTLTLKALAVAGNSLTDRELTPRQSDPQ